jgi:alpha-L-rhamnosidase
MGYNDLAYTLLLNDTFPSWGYSIKYGATTIWERWDGWTEHKGFQTPDMNSFNHYSLGSVLEWLYRYAAGIDLHPSGAGYEAILLRPSPDSRLSSLSASYKSVRGTISSAWKFENGRFTWSVVVPPNTQATAIVPTTDPDSVRESGGLPSTAPGVQFEGTQPGAVMYTLGSGSYEFTAKLDG